MDYHEDPNLNAGKLILNAAQAYEAEIVYYSGPIDSPHHIELLDKLHSYKYVYKNLLLILATHGGSADVAYRIARSLQKLSHSQDAEFLLYTPFLCKSAGTLIAIGADKIIMNDYSELGPLDVQVTKPEELGEYESGIIPIQALSTLKNQSFDLFEEHFISMRFKFGLPTKLAAEIAAQNAQGLFNSLYAQIDPMRLAETYRSMGIGNDYGVRLQSENVKEHTIDRLLSGYPSHSFVIDKEEAKDLFKCVDEPNEDLNKLTKLLLPRIFKEIAAQEAVILPLTEIARDLINTEDKEQQSCGTQKSREENGDEYTTKDEQDSKDS